MATIRIGPVTYQPSARRLERDGQACVLPELSHRVLMALVEAGEEGADYASLMRAAWGRRVVSEDTVKKRVSLLRQSLGEDADTLILSMHGQGYRLAVEVQPVEEVPDRRRWAVPATGLAAGLALAVAVMTLHDPDRARSAERAEWTVSPRSALVEPPQFEADPELDPAILPPFEAALSDSLYRAGWVGQKAPYRMKVRLTMEADRPIVVVDLSTREASDHWRSKLLADDAEQLADRTMYFIRQAASDDGTGSSLARVSLSAD